jgi:hypothetical protein
MALNTMPPVNNEKNELVETGIERFRLVASTSSLSVYGLT